MSRLDSSMRGFTLIELMISLVLGLIIVGAVILVFLSTYNTYNTSSALGRIQENGRFAFELMARDIREAGSLPCGNDINIANVLNNEDTVWWESYGNGMHGYDGDDDFDGVDFGTGDESRISGTDALWLTGTYGNAYSIVSHNASAATFELNTSTHDLVAEEILFVCDFEQGSIFQMTGPNSTNAQVVHNTGEGKSSPGNCTKGLGYPVECTTNGNAKTYGQNSILTHFMSVAWYLGCNGRADCDTPEGRSLYRMEPRDGSMQTDEVADSIADLQFKFLVDDTDEYVDADDVGNSEWSSIVGVQVSVTVKRSNVGVTSSDSRADISRTYTHVVAVRNRLP